MKKQNIVAITFIALLISTLNINLLAQCVDCDANSSANGNYASALGMSANADGQASLAVGLEAYANGNYSLALGKYVISSGASSVTLGRYLETSTSPAMIIGTGYNSSNYLVNSISNSLMIGFNSDKSTLFVKGATGIGYTGKVGIGDVTDPQAKLHIKADNGEAASLFLETYSFGGSNAADLWLGTQDYGLRAMYGKLYFNTGGNYIFNSANANVGIGVLTPHEKLEVNGNIKQSLGF